MFQRPAQPDIHTEFLIIGAGVAGITLAKLLAENGKEVWLLGSPYESQLAKAGIVENTDLPPNTEGLKLMEKISEEAVNVGVKHKTSLVEKLSIDGEFLVETKRQKFYPKSIIIATGAKQAKLNFEGEKEFFHKGISDCSICDYPLYKSRVVGVLGSHEYTIRAANFLMNHAAQVHLFWMNNTEPSNVDIKVKLYSISNIKAYGDEIIEGVIIQSNEGEQDIKLEGLFVEGKPVPVTNFLKDTNIELDENNYIKINDNFETNIKNIFAVGDVTGITTNYPEVIAEVNKLFSKLV
ncbi:MAG: FAD-dependent oxidoreductase [Candidatus Heimdallarchaeota archaeon]|nr:FAD-dependent oxidoreductase [Candidatus Heimdallarchaeota archaeon]